MSVKHSIIAYNLEHSNMMATLIFSLFFPKKKKSIGHLFKILFDNSAYGYIFL